MTSKQVGIGIGVLAVATLAVAGCANTTKGSVAAPSTVSATGSSHLAGPAAPTATGGAHVPPGAPTPTVTAGTPTSGEPSATDAPTATASPVHPVPPTAPGTRPTGTPGASTTAPAPPSGSTQPPGTSQPPTAPAPPKVPPDATAPAAGACAQMSGSQVEVQINVDVPDPRCVIVKPGQHLVVHNNTTSAGQTATTVTLHWAGYAARTLAAGANTTYPQTFGSYLMPGVHDLRASVYGQSGAEIWLQS